MAQPQSVKVRILKPLPGYQVGREVDVLTDDEGTPFDYWWRRRFRDAERDHCVEIVPEDRQDRDLLVVEHESEEAADEPREVQE